MSHYRTGADLERLIRLKLTDDGYWCIRSAGSKSCVDIVAVKAGQVLFVQAKRTKMPPPAERAQLLRIAAYLPGVAVPLVALRPLRQPLEFRRLVGVGAREWEPWTVEET